MRPSWKASLAALIFSYFAACAPVKFDAMPSTPPAACGLNGVVCEKKCEGKDCFYTVRVERKVGEGLVDILIVNDNSGSMSPEQTKMADRFPTFLQSLGSLDYRLAMTTTDVSSRYTSTPIGISNTAGPYNAYGALQDGNLIEFSPGLKYLDRTAPNKETLFKNTIKRQETIRCEQSGFRECPSSDERGIFAANLVLDRTAHEFMRPLAHLAVIVLSDEDERGMSDSRSAKDSNDRALINMYPLEHYDLPETLINKVREKYPEKTMSFHSIIVKPGDKACLSAQSDPQKFIRGVEGYSYAKLSQMTGGKVGSICASDYGAQLKDIGYYLQEQVRSIPLSCRPVLDDFDIKFIPQPANNIEVTADFNKMQINISGSLPPLTKVVLEYECRIEPF